jgi:glycosyltransferase involved in cell wall biosynthesis
MPEVKDAPAPAFSVVMPAFDASETIAESMASVLGQTFSDLELIVVDDGSDDDTVAIVRASADPRVVLLKQNHRGAAAARNAGVARARAPTIAFADSDDLLLPSYLEVVDGIFRDNPDVGFVHTDAYVLNATSGRIRRTTATEEYRPAPASRTPAEFHMALIEVNFVYNAVSIRRDVFDLVGPFNDQLKAAIDYEMWLRIAAHGVPAVEAPGPLAVYRSGRAGSISSDHERVFSNLLTVYEIAAEHPGSDAAKEAVRGRQRAVAAELAAVRGQRTVLSARRRVRNSLARVRARAFPNTLWHPRDRPPPELVRALPHLFSATETY